MSKEKKMRCRTCGFFNLDFITREHVERPGYPFCGLHGSCKVDPDGPQMDLDHHGSCGYFLSAKFRKPEPVQLTINFDEL